MYYALRGKKCICWEGMCHEVWDKEAAYIDSRKVLKLKLQSNAHISQKCYFLLFKPHFYELAQISKVLSQPTVVQRK